MPETQAKELMHAFEEVQQLLSGAQNAHQGASSRLLFFCSCLEVYINYLNPIETHYQTIYQHLGGKDTDISQSKCFYLILEAISRSFNLVFNLHLSDDEKEKVWEIVKNHLTVNNFEYTRQKANITLPLIVDVDINRNLLKVSPIYLALIYLNLSEEFIPSLIISLSTLPFLSLCLEALAQLPTQIRAYPRLFDEVLRDPFIAGEIVFAGEAPRKTGTALTSPSSLFPPPKGDEIGEQKGEESDCHMQ